MLRDHLARTVYRLLDLLRGFRVGITRNHFPPGLELLQSRREQGIVGALAVSLECRGHRSDLGVKVLELAGLLEQDITLGRQNFVHALVVAAASIADELPERRGIFDRVSSLLANPGGGSLDNQTRDRRSVMALNRCLERLFFGCDYSRAIRDALNWWGSGSVPRCFLGRRRRGRRRRFAKKAREQ